MYTFGLWTAMASASSCQGNDGWARMMSSSGKSAAMSSTAIGLEYFSRATGQLMYFLQHGYRVIAHDRRGHGRSTQTADGHDMDHYADDLAEVIAHLDIREAVHVGHSTGGGEVVRYLARHGESRAVKAVLISSVPPLMVQTEANPGGLPKSVFDGFQAQVAASRSEFYRELASGRSTD